VFFLVAHMVPGTVPVGIAGVVVAVLERRSATTRRTMPAGQRLAGVQPMEA
jgi:hypothetical protein